MKKEKKRKNTSCKVLHSRPKSKSSSKSSKAEPKDELVESKPLSKKCPKREEIKSVEDYFDFTENELSEPENEEKNSKDTEKVIINNNRKMLCEFYKDVKDLVETKDKLVHHDKVEKLKNKWNDSCKSYFNKYLLKSLTLCTPKCCI